jgi:hypothetical protein
MDDFISRVCEWQSWSKKEEDWVFCLKPRTQISEPELRGYCDEHYKMDLKFKETANK